jgi:hypothetical protein
MLQSGSMKKKKEKALERFRPYYSMYLRNFLIVTHLKNAVFWDIALFSLVREVF